MTEPVSDSGTADESGGPKVPFPGNDLDDVIRMINRDESPSSVVIRENSKGEPYIESKTYHMNTGLAAIHDFHVWDFTRRAINARKAGDDGAVKKWLDELMQYARLIDLQLHPTEPKDEETKEE